MKIDSAQFVTSAVSDKQYPRLPLPEVAFAGRSNVGKSSLINSLLNRKKLVKTSATPGKTQMINFFNINEQFMFADLPGYGFAKVPDSVKKSWGRMIEYYLKHRETLVTVVLIVDIRRNPTDLDLQMQDWLEGLGLDYILAVTKADKLKQAERNKQIKKIRSAFGKHSDVEMIPCSSKTDLGRKTLWTALSRRINKKTAPL